MLTLVSLVYFEGLPEQIEVLAFYFFGLLQPFLPYSSSLDMLLGQKMQKRFQEPIMKDIYCIYLPLSNI